MEGIILIPGITGSELIFRHTKIWPPRMRDVFGYLEVDELMDTHDINVGNVIDYARLGTGLPLLRVYATLEADLKKIASELNQHKTTLYLPVAYDWRNDLIETADSIRTKIDKWFEDHSPSAVHLVCHSMGGLVGRLLLERNYKAKNKPAWLDYVKSLFCICTPHLGAPRALVESFGVEGASTIRPRDCKKLADNSNFPSAYELFPKSSRDMIFDEIHNKFIKYDEKEVITAFSLTNSNISKSDALRKMLNIDNRPKNTTYFFVFGTGFSTEEGVAVQGLSLNHARPLIPAIKTGDGVVPTWSITEIAQSASIPTWSGDGDHIGIVDTGPFRRELYSFFKVPMALPESGVVVISLNKRFYTPGETVEALVIANEEFGLLKGTPTLSRLDERLRKWVPIGNLQDVHYAGLAPTFSVPLVLTAPSAPGVYRLAFGGTNPSHRTIENTIGWFFVTPAETQEKRRAAQRKRPPGRKTNK
jgi:pimeloyl-ACP methyl ester carboxylesterase